jgi:hypothetical protein
MVGQAKSSQPITRNRRGETGVAAAGIGGPLGDQARRLARSTAEQTA